MYAKLLQAIGACDEDALASILTSPEHVNDYFSDYNNNVATSARLVEHRQLWRALTKPLDSHSQAGHERMFARLLNEGLCIFDLHSATIQGPGCSKEAVEVWGLAAEHPVMLQHCYDRTLEKYGQQTAVLGLGQSVVWQLNHHCDRPECPPSLKAAVELMKRVGSDMNIQLPQYGFRTEETTILLREACAVHFDAACELLLEAGCDPNAAVSHSADRQHTDTLLITALRDKTSPACIELLCRHGADVHAFGQLGMQPLHCVGDASQRHKLTVSTGDKEKGKTAVEIAEILIKYGADVNPQSIQARTPLLHAVENGMPRLVQCLIRHGANINCSSGPLQETPLLQTGVQVSRTLDHIECVRILLEVGACSWRRGSAPMVSMQSNGYQTVAKLDMNDPVTAAIAHNVPSLRAMRFCNIWTPLHAAAALGRVSAARLLLESALVNDEGRPVNERENSCAPMYTIRKTAMDQWVGPTADLPVRHLAALFADTKMLKLLTELGLCSETSKFIDGATELHWVALAHSIDIPSRYGDIRGPVAPIPAQAEAPKIGSDAVVAAATYLLESGASPLIADGKGQLALHWAAQSGATGLVALLLDAGSPLDAASNEDITPLMLAAAHQHSETVELLLERGASLTRRNKTGMRACDLAVDSNTQVLLSPLAQVIPARNLLPATGQWCVVVREGTATPRVLQFDHARDCLDAILRLDEPEACDSMSTRREITVAFVARPDAGSSSGGGDTAGAFGSVALYVMRQSGQPCAVKILIGDANSSLISLNQELQYEIRVQQSLATIGEMSRILGVLRGGPDQQLCSVSEYVPGMPWQWVCEHLGPRMPDHVKAQLAESLLTAVLHLHEQQVAHRDLHGNNVMVDIGPAGQWRIRLIDFGCSYRWTMSPDGYAKSALSKLYRGLLPAPQAVMRASGLTVTSQPTQQEWVQQVDLWGVACLLTWLGATGCKSSCPPESAWTPQLGSYGCLLAPTWAQCQLRPVWLRAAVNGLLAFTGVHVQTQSMSPHTDAGAITVTKDISAASSSQYSSPEVKMVCQPGESPPYEKPTALLQSTLLSDVVPDALLDTTTRDASAAMDRPSVAVEYAALSGGYDDVRYVLDTIQIQGGIVSTDESDASTMRDGGRPVHAANPCQPSAAAISGGVGSEVTSVDVLQEALQFVVRR